MDEQNDLEEKKSSSHLSEEHTEKTNENSIDEGIEPAEDILEVSSDPLEVTDQEGSIPEEERLITEENKASIINALLSSWFPEFTYPRKVYGVQLSKLKILYNLNEEAEEQFFQELGLLVDPLGFHVKMYEYNDETWVCLRSLLGGPTGLTEEEEGVLGVIMYMALKDPAQSTRYSDLEELLTSKKYIKKAHLRYAVQALERNGYISRARGRIALYYKTEIEFDQESIEEIMVEVEKLLV
ncbi:MAG: hypothetical protein KAR35_08870 [Candidatus Heimdallarchaeota archaeon]|nr:hypothetical protein [Candidatus Heimdallarchaeota archaeon]MCK5049468.1 hypothetical protein [Candidatus Heimdallarchaeota archaeon]